MAPDIWFYNLGIKIEHVRNVAVSIGGFDIYCYGICIALAIMAGYAFALHDAKLKGYDPDLVHNIMLPGVLISLSCARLGYIIFDPYLTILDFFAFRNGGLQIYGALIGSLIFVLIYTRIKKVGFFEFTDICVRGLLLGQAIGRWGNFFNREAFGRACDGLFAMRMKLEQVKTVGTAFKEQGVYVYNGAQYPIIDWNGTSYIQVHPTFLYECLWNLGLLVILAILRRKGRDFGGRFTAFYFIGYGIGRFWIESLRTDQLKLLGLPVSMVLSVFFVLIGTTVLCIKIKKD